MGSLLTAEGLLAVYLLAVNLAAFVLYGADKRRAKQDAWRIPEKTLFLLPLLGGALYLVFGNKAPSKGMRRRMQSVEKAHTGDLAQQPGPARQLARLRPKPAAPRAGRPPPASAVQRWRIGKGWACAWANCKQRPYARFEG